jgi:peptide deformylase
MIYPIVAFGDPVLKKKALDIKKEEVDLPKLIEDMFETMYEAHGVGLAAPQIGLGYRLFVIDGEPLDEENLKGFKKVFINPVILEEEGEDWGFEEGCLSIPGIRAEVMRASKLTIEYYDENWKKHKEKFDGLGARIIQHEYDHIEGVLFVDHLSAIKKRLIKAKLSNISKGNVDADYKMKFPVKK